MDKRLFLAVVLTVLVVIAGQVLFPSPSPRPTLPDTTASRPGASTPTQSGVQVRNNPGTPGTPTVRALSSDTVHVRTAGATYHVLGRGGDLLAATMDGYRSLDGSGLPVLLRAAERPLLSYRAVFNGRDTVTLEGLALQGESGGQDERVLRFVAEDGLGHVLGLTYTFADSGYRFIVRGSVTGNSSGRSDLVIDLPEVLQSGEADSLEDQKHLAYAYNSLRSGSRNIGFGSLSPQEQLGVPAPINWVVAKNKYFLVGILSSGDSAALGPARFIGAPKVSKIASRAGGSVVVPVRNGAFAFEVFVGPQQWNKLLAMGRGFQNANPYGGWLRGVVQPFAAIGVEVLLWVRGHLGISYGWILVLIAVCVRLFLWPLNQGAMRTSLRAQQLQPLIEEVRTRYKDDLEKQRAEIMRVYAENGVNPLSPLIGCLPMLLPMPILIALFFVLQNTIEFRGVPFLWVPDISLHDPFYIAPLLSGTTMFILSWVGMRGAPPAPNAKVMLYALPLMMTVLFLNFASGLNLYYAVQNIAGLPQQWFVSRERQRLKVTTLRR